MDYLILTKTDFFNQINNENYVDLETYYDEFIKQVIELCYEHNNRQRSFIAMTYAEIELQYHLEKYNFEMNSQTDLYIRKALSFIQKMLKHLINQVMPPLPTPISLKEKVVNSLSLRWTGNTVDLVEIIYALNEMHCINEGEIPIGELAAFFYALFGVDSKDCYRFYTDIKHRKNDNRAYFLFKMQERLNQRMREDDEKEMQRR
ncbi:RteC domain-containing protein [Bacteroides graminisolvens]|uniref:RteC domain-containing protein n=1 Tax=Bacteroides graminisolvens TaxID=477666 RepID=UPI00240A5B63|nr:RteC domain-containing protein [Bacteroides graminisolvens]